jgi:hypothetical protein
MRQEPDSNPVLSIGVVYNDVEVIRKYLYPSLEKITLPVERLILDNTDNIVTTNIASVYNTFLKLTGPDLLAFLHPDINFEEHFFKDLLSTAETLDRQGKAWGAMGIVGRTWDGRYVWCHEVQEPTPVCTLDSCSLITARSRGIMFDQSRFDQFHCYVEDYCLQCHAQNLGVFVFPTIAHHGSATKKVRGSAWGRYGKYRRRLKLKWWRKFDAIYTC